MNFYLLYKNIGKNLSNKYGQKLLDTAKKSTIDATKTASKRPKKNIHISRIKTTNY